MKILITGGCGFVGVNLIDLLLEKTDWSINVLDNLSTGKKENLPDSERITFIEGDIRNKEDVEKASEVDAIVHLAAQAGVGTSVEDPLNDMDINIKGILILLMEAAKRNMKRFVFASSAAPLGTQEMPLHEKKIPAPLSPYGASKLSGEAYCSAFANSFNVHSVALRFSNIYGPKSGAKESVVALFIKKIMNNDPLTICGDGNQTRDFVHVKDICQAIYLSLIADLSNTFELIQLGTGKETTINELFDLLEKGYGKPIEKVTVPKRVGDIYKNYTDISKAREVLGYEPEVDLEEGLRETVEWFKNNK